jgi:hypothetical protein
MDLRPHEESILGDEQNAILEASSVACTGIADGRVVACGGVAPFGNGNANIWLIPSIYVEQYKTAFATHVLRWLMGVREDLALNRMQSACLADDLHDGWMTFLGFEKEGVLRKYHNGLDYHMWGRIWE